MIARDEGAGVHPILEDRESEAPTSAWGRLKNRFTSQTPLPAPAPVSNASGDAAVATMEEAIRWSTWGAAHGGARTILTRSQKYLFVSLGVVTPILMYLDLRFLVLTLIALITLLYFVTGVYKLWLLVRSEHARGEHSAGIVTADPQAVAEAELPPYTVLVPLHREGKILPVLIDRLRSLDYPTDRLEILLLVEMDDLETQDAIRNYPLPAHIRQLTMPPGQPRTKPRALNVGLSEAHGQYIVIYDAEDRPEPDQLRKGVVAFRDLPEQCVCLQGRLNFYNRYQSILARLFAVDYAAWYDQMLPGLTHAGAFVPLGGTSNHFRVEVLRQLGGWDPFNVTEDCDLGARLSRAGLGVVMLDSVTWEEAVTTIWPWVRQRSRWIKGYLQTYLVHMRHPLQLWRQLGVRGFVDFQMLVGGGSLVLLINPLMWALTLAYVAGTGTSVDAFIETLFPAPLYYPALLSLTLGNFIFFYVNAYVCVRHNYVDLTRYALLTPLYWVLMSAGAWMGLLSLLFRPYYWAKTEHGVSLKQRARGRVAVSEVSD